MKIYADCIGWNGQECGYLVLFEDGCEQWLYLSNPLTNNELEYMGLIKALDIAGNGDIIYSDSMLTVEQVVGRFGCKAPRLIPLWEEARRIYCSKRLKVEWVVRAKNLAGLRVAEVQGVKRYKSRRK